MNKELTKEAIASGGLIGGVVAILVIVFQFITASNGSGRGSSANFERLHNTFLTILDENSKSQAAMVKLMERSTVILEEMNKKLDKMDRNMVPYEEWRELHRGRLQSTKRGE